MASIVNVPRRIALSDDNRWFDPDRAISWEAEDETLYRTHLGGWVLGREDSYQALSEMDAVAWIIRHGYTVPPELRDTAGELE